MLVVVVLMCVVSFKATWTKGRRVIAGVRHIQCEMSCAVLSIAAGNTVSVLEAFSE